MDNISRRELQIKALRDDKVQLQKREPKRTTTGRFHIRIIPVVVFGILMLPLLVSFLLPQRKNEQSKDALETMRNEVQLHTDSDYYVICERPSGTLEVPMEEYLVSALSRIMSVEEPKEALMAMAVLLRTQVVYETEQLGACVVDVLYTLDELEQIYGSKTPNWAEEWIYIQAVRDTSGIIITYEGNALEIAYHKISAGMTRDGEEMFGERFPYLVSVNCEEDMMAAEYFSKINYDREEFFAYLQKLTGNNALTQAEVIIDRRDQAGYVMSVTIQGEGFDRICVGGESFRKIFSLSSSHFEIKENDDCVTFSCKGIGHGYGLSMNQANVLAREGYDFMEIIRYFYRDVVFMRIA